MITTKGKTLQQVNDEIAAALIKQGKRCMNPNSDECAYGDGEGNHCAVGWLLPEKNTEIMDVMGDVDELLAIRKLGPNATFLRESRDFLTGLQELHDALTPQRRQTKADWMQEWFKVDMSAWGGWIALGEEE